MAEDSAGTAITLGATINFVGTVAAISEPDANNVQNIWLAPSVTTVKDNAGVTLFSNFKCVKFNGSQLTIPVP